MRELFHELALSVERRIDERNRDITLAWEIAALTRGTKGLPKLEKLLAKRTKAAQPVSQQRMALEMIFGSDRGRPRKH